MENSITRGTGKSFFTVILYMPKVIILFLSLVLLAHPPLSAGEKPDIRGILSGKIRVWSDFNLRTGYRIEAKRGSLSLFYTEAVNSRGNYRTGGVEGPIFLAGPLERSGLIKDLFNDRFSAAGTFAERTELKMDKDTLSSKSLGCSLFLPGKKGGLWYEQAGDVSTAGLWFNGNRFMGIVWETALTGTLRDSPEAPGEWYPEKWEKPGGWIFGGGTRLSLKHGIFTGGATLLAGSGETILPGIRGELLLHLARGRNFLTFHGGLAMPEYRNTQGELPESLRNGILRFQFKGPLPVIVSGKAEYSQDREGLSLFQTDAGLRFERKTLTGITQWEYSWAIPSGNQENKGFLGLFLDFGSWESALNIQVNFPSRGEIGFKLNLSTGWSDGRTLISTGAGWDSKEPGSITLKTAGGWSESGLTVSFGSEWTLKEEDRLPEFFLTAEYRF
jgi:hypothetical protein